MKSHYARKGAVALLAIVLATGLLVPSFSLANADDASSDALPSEGLFQKLQVPENPQEIQSSDSASQSQEAGECTVTLEYWENVTYDDPDNPPNEDGRRLLGERVLTGLHEGDVLNTWNYVVNIPGYFFWDAWPAKLTVSADPSQNVISLFYFKLWSTQYTVNYYVLTGADLSADNWIDALTPEEVEFTKVHTDTFTNQRDTIIEGDAYEYQVDGLFVIDTYPAEIVLGTDPDNNVLNVLYTPEITTLPDDVEVPSDTIMDKDDLITTLPDDVLVEDFTGVDGDGNLEITDDMLAHPMDPSQAAAIKSAYLESLSMPQTGDSTPIAAAATVGIVALAVAVMAFMFSRPERSDQSSGHGSAGGSDTAGGPSSSSTSGRSNRHDS